MSVLLLAVVAAAVALGCGDSGPSEPSPLPTAPYSQTDLRVGTGAEAVVGRAVTVHYTGWLFDPDGPEQKGMQFDSSISRGQPFPFTVGAGGVIRGWDQGVPGMRVGGQRRLIIPPSLAYGAAGRGSIPANATLVFDIELLSVN
jgi:FKBP-type peptidyl-prolyl cis-trans isomerase FkpA